MKVIFEDGDNVNSAIYRLAEATQWVDVIDNYGHIDDDPEILEKRCTRDALDHLEVNGVEVFFGFGTKPPPTYPTKKPTYRIVENADA